MRHLVIAECVDSRDGKRYFPGDEFPKPEAEQAARLIAARCLKEDDGKPSAETREAAEQAAAEQAAAEQAAAEQAAAEQAAAKKVKKD